MNNERNDNVVGRLGSQNHYQSGDENMYSLPEETGRNESSAYSNEGEDQELLPSYSATIAAFTATFFATIIISIIISRMWDEDEIKLHVLNALIRVLQSIARLCGGWALQCEQLYNNHVNALH